MQFFSISAQSDSTWLGRIMIMVHSTMTLIFEAALAWQASGKTNGESDFCSGSPFVYELPSFRNFEKIKD